MAYDRQFLRVSWLFAIGGTDEVAETSLNFAAPVGWTGAAAALAEIKAATTWGQDVLTDMGTLLGNANLFWADYSDLVAVKVAAVGVDGHYLADPYLYTDVTESGTAAATTLPQSTVVLSLRSGGTFGKANYGRMYLPHTRLGLVAGTPRSNTATTDIVAAAGADFVNSIQDRVNDTITATVIAMIMTNISGQASKAVFQVAVGTVTDTQRRRRAQLIEQYSVVDL